MFGETAQLVAELNLKGNFRQGMAQADAGLKRLSRSTATLRKGLSSAATNLTKIGLVGAGLLGVAVKGGLESLATLESGVTSVDGAIKQLGLTGKVTGAQVATWANEIEASIGAAFDDKDIVQATTTLLRFGKVTPANLKPAMQVMTDLATKTGSVDSAASLLAKALADPAKAAGKLARAGVILTKVEQANINALIKAGKFGKAQQVVLDALTKSTKGAAAASQGPYARSLSTLKDVAEDAQRALAVGFLPVIEKVSSLLSTELAKPQTLGNIKEFGKGLAGGLSSLIDVARGLPWGTIGDSLKIAGSGAKAILEAFTNLPPWVQGAVLTGWGLNKLTGGALGTIVGELGKGLIRGVLGMTAGVVNITAGVVNGGGVPGVAGAGGILGGLGTVAATVLPLVGVAAIKGAQVAQATQVHSVAGLDAMILGRDIAAAEAANQKPVVSAVDTLNADTSRGFLDLRRVTKDVGATMGRELRRLPIPRVSVTVNTTVGTRTVTSTVVRSGGYGPIFTGGGHPVLDFGGGV